MSDSPRPDFALTVPPPNELRPRDPGRRSEPSARPRRPHPAKSQQEALDAVSVEAVDRAERRLRLWGLLVIAAIFGGLGIWAAVAPLASAAIGSGVIAVEGYRKTVQHLEGGIVKSIKVRDGDIVHKDQVLLELDDTQPRAQLEVLRGQWLMAAAEEARLLAERDGKSAVTYPADLLAFKDDARAQDAMRIQNQAFEARRTSIRGETTLHARQIEQLQAKLNGLSAQRTSRDQLAGSYGKELDDVKPLAAEGYVPAQRVRDIERNVAQVEGQRGALESEHAATRVQINETRVKSLQLQNEFQRNLAADLTKVQTNLFDLRAKLKSLEDTVARTIVRAPEAGIVLGMTVHSSGAVLRAGDKLLDVVPRGERLIVEAQLSPQDIDQVHIGQTAEVRFPAFKHREVPHIDGMLISVSADRLLEETSAGKMPYYLARVSINPDSMAALQRAKLQLLPGMPAEVFVKTGERTMWAYLLAPLKDSIARGMKED